VPELDRDTAQHWIERWDRQQEESLPDREERFTALIDAVEEGAGRPDPLVLDIGCGPGSLGVRLLERLPRAVVIGINADPVSLVLGRAAYRDVPGLRLVDLDLRVPGWSARLGLNPRARVDAAVSTTALHWLQQEDLRAMYAEVATVLGPAVCCSTVTTSPSTPRSLRPSPVSTGRCGSERTGGASPAGTQRAGPAGGKRSPPTRHCRSTSPSASAAWSRRVITTRSRSSSPPTSRRSRRPASPRSTPSAATTRHGPSKTSSTPPSPWSPHGRASPTWKRSGRRCTPRASRPDGSRWTVQGWPRHVIRRGQTLLADGSSLAQPGQGQWVRRNRG
jgi:SAM-dependent methyltransferase